MWRSIKILKVIFVIPFSIGNPIKGSINTMDGSCSTRILFTCLISILTVIVGTFSGTFRYNEDSKKMKWWLIYIIVTILTIATINIFLIFYYRNYHQFHQNNPSVETDSSTKLQLRFLWIFGLGLLLRTSLSIAIDTECLVKEFSTSYISYILSSSVLIVFMISQIGLITYMHNLTFSRSLRIYYCIGIILLANATLWFNFTALGIASIVQVTTANTTQSHFLSNMISDKNVSNSSNSCYTSSKIYSFAAQLQPYLFQVSLDFFLLSTLFLVKMLPSFRYKHIQNMSNQTRTTTPRLDHRKCAIISMVMGIVFYIPLFVISLLIRFVFFDKSYALVEAWQNIMILQKSVLLLAILFAFSHLRDLKTEMNVWRLESGDYILFSCFVGKVAIHVFEITAATFCAERKSLLFKSLISLVFYFYQTLYIVISKRSSGTTLKHSNVSVSIHVLLMTVSLTQWITTTFILSEQGHFVLNEGIGCLFQDLFVWKMLQYISVPFTIYYDLQSAMHFYSILPKLRFVNHE